jgi:hypothetical protein
METMTEQEQHDHEAATLAIRSALSALRLTRVQDEDVQVAITRLDNWLTENDGRWVKNA